MRGLSVIGLLLLGLALVAFVVWCTMILWNWLMPEIFGLIELDFWQTFGLMVLSTSFFYRGSSSRK